MGYIVADQINKILAERKPLQRKMTISTNIKINNVEKKNLVIGEDKKQGMDFDFLFTTTYGENGSKIEVEGTIFYLGDKKELDDIEKSWKEKKALPDENIALIVNNRALEIGLLQSIAMASQLRLPTPIKLPKFVLGTEAKAEKK
jgi:hypothetical protein